MFNPSPARDKTVLIVEDNSDIAQLLASMLAGKCRKILRAADGVEGLKLARWQAPDFILLDMKLPQMNGLAVLQALQEQPQTASIPVLILTGSHFDARTKELLQQIPNVKAFLSKTCGAKRLREQIVQFLAS